MHSKTSKNKKFILGALAVLILIVGAFFIFKREPTVSVSAAGENWLMHRLSGWNYRKQIDITNNSGSVLTDYPMKFNVAYESNMRSDFNDVRFTMEDGFTVLPYWIESINTVANPDVATIWVKIPKIELTESHIVMHYGKPDATTPFSNGENTFDFFDDFPGTTLDATKWDIYVGAPSVSVGSITVESAGDETITTKNQYGTGYAIRTRASTPIAKYAMLGFFQDSNPNHVAAFYPNLNTDNQYAVVTKAGGTATKPSIGATYTGNRIWEVARNGSTSVIFKVDDAVVATSTTNISTDNIKGTYRTSDEGANPTIVGDWFLVRKYVAIEPTYTMWAEEPYTEGKAYDRRKAITVVNSGGALSDYQIQTDVAYDSHMQPDFDDIRFTDSTGSVILSHWIESYNSNVAKVWVKIPSIQQLGTTIIYMYYGDDWTMSGSSGVNTFPFFDDFLGVGVDVTKWNISAGTPSVSGGSITIEGTYEAMTTKNQYGTEYAIRSKASTPIAKFSLIGFFEEITHRAAFYVNLNNDIQYAIQTQAAGTATGVSVGATYTGNRIWEVARNGSTSVIFKVDDAVVATSTTNISTQAIRGSFFTDDQGANPSIVSDWFLVRKYTLSEPTVIFNSEEVPAGVCGPFNAQYFSSTPSISVPAKLCSSGALNGFAANGAGIWTWTCNGVGGTTPTHCSTTISDGSRRKTIAITNNSGGPLTDYQMLFSIPYDSYMQPDFDDIRFMHWSGSPEYSYWIESIDTTPNPDVAKIWVKIPNIPVGTDYVKYFFGNSAATSASNGNDTFINFDDFSGTTLDTTKWTQSGTGTAVIAGGVAKLSCVGSANSVFLTSTTTQPDRNYIVGTKLRATNMTATSGANNSIRAGHDSKYKDGLRGSSGVIHNEFLEETIAWEGSTARTATVGTWYVYETWFDGSSVKGTVDRGTVNSWAKSTVPTYKHELSAYSASTYPNAVGEFDWAYVRKYVANESSVLSYDIEGGDTWTLNGCGSSNGTYRASAPTTNLCDGWGTPTVTGTGPWYWTCNNLNMAPSSCMAYVSGQSSLKGWSYKKLITVANSSGTTQYDYSTKINVVAGNMKSDFSDLRFTDLAGTTQYDYWIESIDTVADPDVAKVWVKVPSIPTTGTTLYMYYGNNSATPVSNGTETFLFFDDFSGTTIDSGTAPAKWSKIDSGEYITQNETLNISDGNKSWSAGTGMYTNTDFNRSDGIIIQGKYKTTEVRGTSYYDETVIGTKKSNSGITLADFIYGLHPFAVKTESYFVIDEAGAWIEDAIVGLSADTQYDFRQIIKPSGAITQVSTDGGNNWTYINFPSLSTSTEATFKAGFTHFQGGDSIIDNIIVRKSGYSGSGTYTDPIIPSIGPENPSAGPSVINMVTNAEDGSSCYCSNYFNPTYTSLLPGNNAQLQMSFDYVDEAPATLSQYKIVVSDVDDVTQPLIATDWINRSAQPGDTIQYNGTQISVKISPSAPSYQIGYGDTYYWWVKVKNNGSVESSWTKLTFNTPPKHFPAVIVIPVTAAINVDTQLCSGTDINNPSAPCYSTCWKGAGSPADPSDVDDWKCSVCYNSSGNPASCSTNPGTTIKWVIPAGTNYSGTLSSANPVIRFTSAYAGLTVGLSITGSECGNNGSFNISNSPIVPKWKEVSPF